MDKKIEVMPTRRQVLEDLDFLERLYELRGKDDIINWILNEYHQVPSARQVCFCCKGKDVD